MPESIQSLIDEELVRQSAAITLIPSENHASVAVLAALGSRLNDKYAEGYPGKRYYAGNQVLDRLETQVQALAQQAFSTDYSVNVQPLSGATANLAVYNALLEPGDTVLSLSLAHGGHLSHGHSVSLTSKIWKFVHYGVTPDAQLIDMDAVAALAHEHRPKLIVCGATAYPMQVDFAAFAAIAKEVGAYLLADIAHVSGLVAGKAYQSPFGHADVVTTTTHKSLRGPRGAMIFTRDGLNERIDKSVFPGLQGGPFMHVIGALGVALEEAIQPAFGEYAKQIVRNAQALSFALQQRGVTLVAGGTDSHLLLIDLRAEPVKGNELQDALESIGLITNKNSVPFDPNPPRKPSGLRLGTPAVTTRGMREQEMAELADIIAAVLGGATDLTPLAERVSRLSLAFPIPSHR